MIARLPEGYDTIIGEPGLLLADEATSALDPETEKDLAACLIRGGARTTTLLVAHRLTPLQA
ncbi:P-loop NTPase family protein [Henriciella aquimarina]|uniref:hypothetical protein n=1 Tax=Henriciella aquimarina TaxID=545261 RepID=UPI0009FE47DF|nr:hypothetical protein [Henriciella aquimarina]